MMLNRVFTPIYWTGSKWARMTPMFFATIAEAWEHANKAQYEHMQVVHMYILDCLEDFTLEELSENMRVLSEPEMSKLEQVKQFSNAYSN